MSRFCWRTASRFTTSAMRSSSCTPLISTRAPSRMEIFTSWRIVPRPRFTRPVDLSTMPRYAAISRTSSGDFMQGEVVISTSGIPRRSRENVSPSTRCAASSSRQMVSMLPPFGSIPSSATRAVLWNPLVLDPSMTSFRMVWTCPIGVIDKVRAMVQHISRASGLSGAGGSSSYSTRQVES